MRCLGRIVLLFVLVVLAALAWLYRDDLRRFVDRTLHPGTAAQRIGHPSTEAYTSGMSKLSTMLLQHRDSVTLSADETASLLTRGVNFLPGAVRDSLTLELETRTVRIRTVIDSARIPATFRRLIPGHNPYEELVVRGTFTPIHAGLGEVIVQQVRLHGVPLPTDLVSRATSGITGTAGRIEVTLPEIIDGFRVSPDGVTVYRAGRK